MQSAGNFALMRIALILIPHLNNPSPELWADAALNSMLTRNDSASIAACVAFVHLLWESLRMDKPPEPQWWPDMYSSVLRQVETGDVYELRGPAFDGVRSTLSELLERELPATWRAGTSVRGACDRWHSGAYIPQTVPCALYILMRHAHDPEEAIVRAVNDTWDNDTIAAVVGAAVGALHGEAGLPERWRIGLSGRTTSDDDARVWELLAEAERMLGPRIDHEPERPSRH